MKSSKTHLVAAPHEGMTTSALLERLRFSVAYHVEEILAEVPATLRRLRTFLLMAALSIPLLVIGFVALLWHVVH